MGQLVTALLAALLAIPGSLNTGVTQRNIASTICKAGWSASVRPSSSKTTRYKRILVAGLHDPSAKVADFELDHLVPIELGGATFSPDNLWLELWPEARKKDQLENTLHRLVCAGRLPLSDAQTAISTDWAAAYTRYVKDKSKP